MTLLFTGKSSKGGEEPTELLKPLAFEYLEELYRRKMIDLIEADGKDGKPVLLAVISNAKISNGKIVEIADEK